MRSTICHVTSLRKAELLRLNPLALFASVAYTPINILEQGAGYSGMLPSQRLLLRSQNVTQQQLQEMAQHVPHGRYVQVTQASHDLHLDRPQLWQQIAETFLETLQS